MLSAAGQRMAPNAAGQRMALTTMVFAALTALTCCQDATSTCVESREADLCFVHVGKSGGASIQQALARLMTDGYIGDLVQIHSRFALTSRETCARSHLTHADETHRSSRVGGGRRMDARGEGLRACNATGRVLLWVRDPIEVRSTSWMWGALKIGACPGSVALSARSTGLHPIDSLFQTSIKPHRLRVSSGGTRSALAEVARPPR